MASGAARSAAQLASVLKAAALGGGGLYALSNSIFNVEGGHRAVIFNRVVGIKDTARYPRLHEPSSLSFVAADAP
jgi:hypothetical protein